MHQVESKRMDLEECCGEALELYSKELMGFDEHQFDIPGCKEGLIVVDGIEKVRQLLNTTSYRLMMGFVQYISAWMKRSV